MLTTGDKSKYPFLVLDLGWDNMVNHIDWPSNQFFQFLLYVFEALFLGAYMFRIVIHFWWTRSFIIISNFKNFFFYWSIVDFFGRNDAKAETPVLRPPHAKGWLIGKDSDAGRDWAGGEGDDGGWDGWMASLTRWTWVWVNSWSWWWTGRPGVLRFMGSQRVGHDWATDLIWSDSWFAMLGWFQVYSKWISFTYRYNYFLKNSFSV